MTTLSGVPTATGLCVPQRIRGPHQAPPLWLSSVRRHGLNATCLQQMKDPRRCLPAEPFQLAARNLAPLWREAARKKLKTSRFRSVGGLSPPPYRAAQGATPCSPPPTPRAPDEQTAPDRRFHICRADNPRLPSWTDTKKPWRPSMRFACAD